MKHLIWVVAVIALAVSAQAAPVNALLGVPWLAESNFNDFAGNTDHYVFTDGNYGGNGPYGQYDPGNLQAWVSFDFGRSQAVNALGIAEYDHSRRVPLSVQLDFSNDNFATVLATRTVSLLNLDYQTVSFSDVGARYVKFVFPAGIAGYYDDGVRTDPYFGRYNELELFPEPASRSLLALGGLALGRRRK